MNRTNVLVGVENSKISIGILDDLNDAKIVGVSDPSQHPNPVHPQILKILMPIGTLTGYDSKSLLSASRTNCI